MTDPFHTIVAEGVGVTLDLRVGHVRDFWIERDGRRIAPLHTAPWVDEAAVTNDDTLPGNLRHLSGDFFCAPFCGSDVEPAPPHGWPANSAWRHITTTREPGAVTAVYRLARTVLGATVEKRFTLRDGHPFLYERHDVIGGSGALPMANHAMVALPSGGTLAFSPKDAIETPDGPLETDPALGRSRLLCPARTQDPTRVPLADGGTTDITRYPIADRHDDFLTLVEARGATVGWFAASRPTTGDAVLSLKNPAELPLTFLWFSNGGRDYAPWNGRHRGVLGIEEGRADAIAGHAAALRPNAFTAHGIPTAFTLQPEGRVVVHNIVGAVPLPVGNSPIADVTCGAVALQIACRDGSAIAVPFDGAFLNRD